MKKFITSLVSLVLAGSMAFALTACNPGDGGDPNDPNNPNNPNNPGGTELTEAQKWSKMFDDLVALDNFTLETESNQKMGLTYNGEYVTEETQFDDETGTLEMMIPQMLAGLDLDEENPVVDNSTTVEKADFANGKYAATSHDDPEEYDYAVVNGTTIKLYGWEEDEDAYYLQEYIGYDSAARAKEVFKNTVSPFASLLTLQLSGTGDKANVKGSFGDLYELFTLDAATGVYSASLYMDMDGMPEDTPVSFSFKVENGAIVSCVQTMDASMSLADMMANMMDEGEEGPDMSALFEGFDIEMVYSSEMTVKDKGTTTVTVPSDIDSNVYYSNTNYMLTKSIYEAAFAAIPAQDGTIGLSIGSYDDGVNVSTKYLYNEDLGVLKVTKTSQDWNSGVSSEESTLYWLKGGELKTFVAEYDNSSGSYSEFIGWGEPTTEPASGGAEKVLLSKLPAEAQLYFNFNGKPMAECFDAFDIVYYQYYETTAEVNGKDCEISLNYYTNDDNGTVEYHISGYSVDDGDNYVSVSLETGDLLSTKLPDVGTVVDSSEWAAKLAPWANLKNVSVDDGNSVFKMDIAADGNSGKIYNISKYDEQDNQYLVFTKSGDGYEYTRYYSGWDWETMSGKRYKVTGNADSINDLINMVSGTAILYLNGASSIEVEEGVYKTLPEIAFMLNEITGYYSFTDCYDTTYGISFGTDSMTLAAGYNTYVIFNVGTTVLGEIPQFALDGEVQE